MRLALIAIIGLTACASSKEQTDSTTPLTIDTMKPDTAAAAAAVRDSVAATLSPTNTPAAPPATRPETSTKAPPVATDTSLRDRAIKINTRDPRRQLPTVDTTKKKPPR